MRLSTTLTPIFFGLYFIYKLFGDNTNDYWVCSMWLIISFYLMIVKYQLSNQFFIKIHRTIWRVAAYYWGVMTAIHILFMFKISLYSEYVESANKFTVGAAFIVLSFIYLIYKIYSNDKNNGAIYH